MAIQTSLNHDYRTYVLELTDVSASSSTYAIAVGRGRVVAVYTVLHGAISGANATLTPKINGVSMTAGGRGVASAAVQSGGTGYSVGDLLVLRGGHGAAARLAVATLSGSAVATVTVDRAGDYSEIPADPVAVALATPSAGQSGATFNLTMSSNTATITVAQSGSAAGDVDSCFPSGLNTVNPGDYLQLTSNGNSDDTARLTAVFVVNEF